jgi:hypothetical protein
VERVAVAVMRESLTEVERAATGEPGEWDAFARVMRHMARLRSSQLFPVSRGRATEPGPELAAIRTSLLAALEDLVVLTQNSGALRDDVNAYDLVLMLNSIPPRLPDAADGSPMADLAGRHICHLRAYRYTEVHPPGRIRT